MNNENNIDKKDIVALAINIILVVIGLIGLIETIIGFGNPALEYYTQLSNYFALISATIYTVYLYKSIKGKAKGNNNNKEIKATTIPKWVSILKYSSTLSLLVTFLVVVFILTPMFGLKSFSWMLFQDTNFYFHTICPILTFVSFIFFETHYIKGLRDNIRAMYFTMIYATLFIILNILRVVKGPYPFLMVHDQPIYMSIIWFILIVGGAFGLSMLIMWIKNKQQNK